MSILLSEVQALAFGFLLVKHPTRRGRSRLPDGAEPGGAGPRAFLRQAPRSYARRDCGAGQVGRQDKLSKG